MNRFQDAIDIQRGACNPSGVARALVKAIDELLAEGADTPTICADPAVRLICHQLAFLPEVEAFNESLTAYSRATVECEERAKP